jgi:hypothetical protein
MWPNINNIVGYIEQGFAKEGGFLMGYSPEDRIEKLVGSLDFRDKQKTAEAAEADPEKQRAAAFAEHDARQERYEKAAAVRKQNKQQDAKQ